MIGWVAFCTNTSVRLLELPIVFVERHTPRCERWVSSVRRECLDWLMIIGRRHLEVVLAEYVEHYNGHRPHRGLELRPPLGPTVLPAVTGQVVRRTRVHGLINEYSRQAA